MNHDLVIWVLTASPSGYGESGYGESGYGERGFCGWPLLTEELTGDLITKGRAVLELAAPAARVWACGATVTSPQKEAPP